MALVTPLICHEQRLGVDPKSGITKRRWQISPTVACTKLNCQGLWNFTAAG